VFYFTSNTTSINEVRSARLFVGMWCPLVSVITTLVAIIFHCQVWYCALSVCYASTRSSGTTTDDLEWPWMAVSCIARYLCGGWASCLLMAECSKLRSEKVLVLLVTVWPSCTVTAHTQAAHWLSYVW